MSRPWYNEQAFSLSPFVANLDAICEKINFNADREASVDNLRLLLYLYGKNIPFNNIDNMIEKKIILDPDLIEKKILSGKGGYCFELNLHLYYVLSRWGYQVTPSLARTRWNVPDLLDSRWLVDVAFTACNPTGPIRISSDEQVFSHDMRRVIINEKGLYLHQVKFPMSTDWISCYTFIGDEVIPIDCALSNHWANTNPIHRFVSNLVGSSSSWKTATSASSFKVQVFHV